MPTKQKPDHSLKHSLDLLQRRRVELGGRSQKLTALAGDLNVDERLLAADLAHNLSGFTTPVLQYLRAELNNLLAERSL